MKRFYINAMNVETGTTKMHTVEGENKDHAVQRLESDEYVTDAAPYGWEVVYCDIYEYYE